LPCGDKVSHAEAGIVGVGVCLWIGCDIELVDYVAAHRDLVVDQQVDHPGRWPWSVAEPVCARHRPHRLILMQLGHHVLRLLVEVLLGADGHLRLQGHFGRGFSSFYLGRFNVEFWFLVEV
jgi:hypothetical protein